MRKGNGKSEAVNLDLERELPAADSGEENGGSSAVTAADPGGMTEVEKLKAERDTLLDRLARQQAEFDNARKRATREQQEFREFAAADVLKNFLPVLDSFERALKARRRGQRVPQRNRADLPPVSGCAAEGRSAGHSGGRAAVRSARA